MQLRVHEREERLELRELTLHAALVAQKIALHALHDGAKAPEREDLVRVGDDVQRAEEVAHALDVVPTFLGKDVREQDLLRLLDVLIRRRVRRLAPLGRVHRLGALEHGVRPVRPAAVDLDPVALLDVQWCLCELRVAEPEQPETLVLGSGRRSVSEVRSSNLWAQQRAHVFSILSAIRSAVDEVHG